MIVGIAGSWMVVNITASTERGVLGLVSVSMESGGVMLDSRCGCSSYFCWCQHQKSKRRTLVATPKPILNLKGFLESWCLQLLKARQSTKPRTAQLRR